MSSETRTILRRETIWPVSTVGLRVRVQAEASRQTGDAECNPEEEVPVMTRRVNLRLAATV